jgi:hypothetical protein
LDVYGSQGQTVDNGVVYANISDSKIKCVLNWKEVSFGKNAPRGKQRKMPKRC